MKAIDRHQIDISAVDLWMNRWMVLTAGTIDDCNMMTVAWGSIGCMWARPFVQVVVRPVRYTFGFMEKSADFTVCAFPEKFRGDLKILGSQSGRDGDKLAATGLSLKASSVVSAPSYQEADFILECRKLYYQDMNPAGFVDSAVHENYPHNDYHRVYFGEILAAFQA